MVSQLLKPIGVIVILAKLNDLMLETYLLEVPNLFLRMHSFTGLHLHAGACLILYASL